MRRVRGKDTQWQGGRIAGGCHVHFQLIQLTDQGAIWTNAGKWHKAALTDLQEGAKFSRELLLVSGSADFYNPFHTTNLFCGIVYPALQTKPQGRRAGSQARGCQAIIFNLAIPRSIE